MNGLDDIVETWHQACHDIQKFKCMRMKLLHITAGILERLLTFNRAVINTGILVTCIMEHNVLTHSLHFKLMITNLE